MRVAAALMCVGLMCLLAGCGGSGDDNGSGLPRADLRLTDQSLGGMFYVVPGQTVLLALQENGGTGYQWQCSWDPADHMELLDEGVVAGDSPMPGAPTTHYFLLQALQQGTVTVTLLYGRIWEADPASYTITINVL
jgi:predicted secreted protein